MSTHFSPSANSKKSLAYPRPTQARTTHSPPISYPVDKVRFLGSRVHFAFLGSYPRENPVQTSHPPPMPRCTQIRTTPPAQSTGARRGCWTAAVLAKTGPKLNPSTAEAAQTRGRAGSLWAQKVTAALIAQLLSEKVERPIIDHIQRPSAN